MSPRIELRCGRKPKEPEERPKIYTRPNGRNPRRQWITQESAQSVRIRPTITVATVWEDRCHTLEEVHSHICDTCPEHTAPRRCDGFARIAPVPQQNFRGVDAEGMQFFSLTTRGEMQIDAPPRVSSADAKKALGVRKGAVFNNMRCLKNYKW